MSVAEDGAQLPGTESAQQRELAEGARMEARAHDRRRRQDEAALRGVRAEMVHVRRDIPGKGSPCHHAQAAGGVPLGNVIDVLPANLLISITRFLTHDLAGIRALGRLTCTCKFFVAKSIREPQAKEEETKPAAATAKKEIAHMNIVGTVAKLAHDVELQGERQLAETETQAQVANVKHAHSQALVAAGNSWLRALWALRQWGRWTKHSADCYTVGGDGATLTVMADPSHRVALGGPPMVMGGVGVVFYAEVEVTVLCPPGGRTSSYSHDIFIGVGRAGLDVGRKWAYRFEEFWGVDGGSGNDDGSLVHADQSSLWAGQQGFGQGDTIGLLLNSAGTLTVYKKGKQVGTDWNGQPEWDSSGEGMSRLGVAAEGLTGELCWAVALQSEWSKGSSLRLTAKPPPAGWRDYAVAAESEATVLREAKEQAEEAGDDYYDDY